MAQARTPAQFSPPKVKKLLQGLLLPVLSHPEDAGDLGVDHRGAVSVPLLDGELVHREQLGGGFRGVRQLLRQRPLVDLLYRLPVQTILGSYGLERAGLPAGEAHLGRQALGVAGPGIREGKFLRHKPTQRLFPISRWLKHLLPC